MKRIYILGFLVALFFNLLLIGCSTLNNTSAPADTNNTDKATTPAKTYCIDNTSWEMILYLPGIENQGDPDYKVVDSSNFKFVENTNGTAKLSGEVRFVNGSDRGFQVEVNLSGKTTTGTPEFSTEVPSSTDTSNWYYYPTYTGTLTGVGTYQGMALSISNADGEPIQVGTGANLVDASDLGLYIWTEYKRVNQGASVSAPASGEADFHIKLISCPADKASLGNRAWIDSNSNGIQDDDEAGLAGVTVDLYDGKGNFVDSKTTDTNGNYLFSDLDAGNYSLDITLPNSNQSFTLQNKGDNDAVDSDVNPNDGTVTGITLSTGENDLDWDIGVKQSSTANCTGSLGNLVWLDSNQNGLQDTDEIGIGNVRVVLENLTSGTTTDTRTDSNGVYKFEGLCAGDYRVNVIESTVQGFTPTQANVNDNGQDDKDSDSVNGNPVPVTLTYNSSQDLTIDFGYVAPDCSGTASIGDFVWNDLNRDGMQDDGEHGIDGVVLDLYKDDNGNGIIDDGEDVAHTTTTANGGLYSFDDVCVDSTYILKLKEENFAAGKPLEGFEETFRPPFLSLVLLADDSFTFLDFGYAKPIVTSCSALIGNYVWHDENNNGLQDSGEPGIANAKVDLKDSDGNILASDITDNNGAYEFRYLCSGNYQVDIAESTIPHLVPTLANANNNSQDDKDSDSVNGGPVPVTLTSDNSQDLTIDFGFTDNSGSLDCDLNIDLDKDKLGDAAGHNVFLIKGGTQTHNTVVTFIPHWWGNILEPGQKFIAADVSYLINLIKENTYPNISIAPNVNNATYVKRWNGRIDTWLNIRLIDRRATADDHALLKKWIRGPNAPKELVVGVHIQNADGSLVTKDICFTGFDNRFQLVQYITPVAFDLNGDGKIGVTGSSTARDADRSTLGQTVKFDMYGNGQPIEMEWFVGDGDGILVDNRDGLAATQMNGTRLFGDQRGRFSHGYEQLALLDTNGDAQLSGAELEGLAFWVDDGDAVVQDGELQNLAAYDIVSISTTMTMMDGLMRSSAMTSTGTSIMSEDVWFLALE